MSCNRKDGKVVQAVVVFLVQHLLDNRTDDAVGLLLRLVNLQEQIRNGFFENAEDLEATRHLFIILPKRIKEEVFVGVKILAP